MTAPHGPGTFLAEMVPGTLGSWAPPLVMGVTGDQEVFAIVAEGLEESHMSIPGHALRVAQATVTGMTKPGDGKYASHLREAHERWGVSPELIGRVWQWATVFVAKADTLANGYHLAHGRAGRLLSAAQTHGAFINADAEVVRRPLSLDEEQVKKHFSGICMVSEAAVSAFWEVADHPRIRELLPPNATDTDILTHCRQFLPDGFVALFAR